LRLRFFYTLLFRIFVTVALFIRASLEAPFALLAHAIYATILKTILLASLARTAVVTALASTGTVGALINK
jgi:hypothetical protein